jgi:hypothetical protein
MKKNVTVCVLYYCYLWCMAFEYCAPVVGWCAKSPQFSCLLRRFLKFDC